MRPVAGRPADRGNVMIVDDNPANLKLLEDMLRQQGHEVHAFPRGRMALQAAARNPPDLILLDINMPEMNGYEVCERLKSSDPVAGIPVIFLSALTETRDKVKAFQSGAVDYIAKPFQFEEVHARVETHLKLHNLQRALEAQNDRLEEAVAARTHELAEANGRLTILDRSKNEFLNLISHEFRTPLNGLLGVSELILDEMPSTAENRDLRDAFACSRQRILSLLDDALLLTQIDVGAERFSASLVSLGTVLNRAIENATEFAQSRRVTLTPPSPVENLIVGDEDLMVRALDALLKTAVRFSADGDTVRLAQARVRDSLRVTIDSHGKTIPAHAIPKFFDLFAIAESGTPGKDLGLGPALACRILYCSVRRSVSRIGIRPEYGSRLRSRTPNRLSRPIHCEWRTG
jgi:two-component system sensor histidine kinase/response regulator